MRSQAYREPARETTAEPPAAPGRGGAGASVASAAMLGAAALGGATSAAALGSLELLVLAGAGALAAAAHLARASRCGRRRREVLDFLGDGVVVEPGVWTSADGSRRVRAVRRDDHLRFETLELVSGVTLSSHRVRLELPFDPPRRSTRRRRSARVHGRPIHPCCFDGLPGRDPVLRHPASIELEESESGVLLRRLDDDGALVGDTWHATEAEARRQLAHELGPHLGPWTKAPRRAKPTRGWEPSADAHLGL